MHANVGWRALTPGGIVGGIALWALQLVGATYVTRVIVGASDVYGAFATMFGLLVWIALLARVTLLASEVNVVRAKHLWPRSLRATPPTDADRRALEATMRREVYQDPELLDSSGPIPTDLERVTPNADEDRPARG